MESGDVIAGRYHLESVIGRGGLGVIWRAQQAGIARPVAVKFMHSITSPDQRRRFNVEARLLGKLQHPGCVAVYDFGEFDNATPFLVMELLEGESLESRRGQRLPIADVVRITRAIAVALKHAHDHGIVHRDLKPENVFVTRSGQIKLLDFGLAKCLDEGGPAITATGECIGTPHYMSPEQARDTRSAGPAADQYSLGVMMFEMLTGSRPFDGSTMEIVMSHIQREPPPLDRADCPPSLEAIVTRLLAKQPSQRFPDCGALIQALDAIAVRGGPVEGVSAPSSSPNRRTWIVPMLLAALTVGALAAFMAFYAEEQEPAPPAEQQSRNVSALTTAQPSGPVDVDDDAPTSRDAGGPGGDVERPDAMPDGALPPVTLSAAPSSGCGVATAPENGEVRISLTIDGIEREAWAYLPPAYDADEPTPAIVALTYRRRSAREYVSRANIEGPAADAGFIVVGLEAIDSDFKPTQSPFKMLEGFEETAPPHQMPWDEPGDIAFIREALERMKQRACIDENRIFGIGHAEGAAMLQRLTCEEDFEFAAIALTGAAATAGANCKVRHAVPLLRVSGADDTFVPVAGGKGCAGDKFMSATATDEVWGAPHGCADAESKPWLGDERCVLRACEHAPYIGCVVDGGHYLAPTFYNEPGVAKLTESLTSGLGDRKADWFDPTGCSGSEPLDLSFEDMVLPLFLHYAATP